MANPVTRMNLSLRTYEGAVELCSTLLHKDTTSSETGLLLLQAHDLKPMGNGVERQ